MREEDFELTFELDPSPRAPEPEQAPELAIETEEDAPQPAAPAAEQAPAEPVSLPPAEEKPAPETQPAPGAEPAPRQQLEPAEDRRARQGRACFERA